MSGEHVQKLTSISKAFGSSNSLNLAPATATTSATSNRQNLTITTTTSSLANHRYVKLNVGGRLFTTSIDTLTKHDSMLRAMFSGRMDVVTDLDGYILIDRCGKHFELILNYLRDEDPMCVSMHLTDKSELELYEILKEAKFFCIQQLASLIEQKILVNKASVPQEPYYGSSVVSMVTSKIDLVKILNSTDKVTTFLS
jgi:BTB/POZ domain-containing adapter for CUL3-mediated RhoA degradation protein